MNLIAAVDKDWGIGLKGRLLVSIPQDQKLFQEETLGKVIVMGRKTLATFPNQMPLFGRKNIILSRNPDLKIKGAVVVHSLEECLKELEGVPDQNIFVIGGQDIYEMFLPYCQVAHITYMDYRYQADRHCPNLDQNPEWELALESEEQTYFDIEYYFRMYRRK